MCIVKPCAVLPGEYGWWMRVRKEADMSVFDLDELVTRIKTLAEYLDE